jgi:signal transduction histidine kinase
VHGESAFARKRNGPGLGLAMCRRILDMHGGRLRIESLPSETRVQLVYPAGRLERPGVALPGPVRAAAV